MREPDLEVDLESEKEYDYQTRFYFVDVPRGITWTIKPMYFENRSRHYITVYGSYGLFDYQSIEGLNHEEIEKMLQHKIGVMEETMNRYRLQYTPEYKPWKYAKLIPVDQAVS